MSWAGLPTLKIPASKTKKRPWSNLARTTFSTLAPQIKTEDFREAEELEEEEEEELGDGNPAWSKAACHASCNSGLPPPLPINGAMAAAVAAAADEEAEEEVPSGKTMWTPVR